MTKSPPRPIGGLYDDKTECPILHVFKNIGGKWKLPVLWHLTEKETMRYNELKRSVRGVTNMMLTKCLRELEDYGLVQRRQYNVIPPRVEYSLTESGKKLLPALEELYAWGQEHMNVKMAAEMTKTADCSCQPRSCPDDPETGSTDGIPGGTAA